MPLLHAKLLRALPCLRIANLTNMLLNRTFRVIMGYLKIDQMKLNNGQSISYYTFDITLSVKEYLLKIAGKVKMRNNIKQLQNMLNSNHCKFVDVQLNQTMRMIWGTIKSTSAFWLPVLRNIAPPHLWKNSKKNLNNHHLPTHFDINNIKINRLQSSYPSAYSLLRVTSILLVFGETTGRITRPTKCNKCHA